MERLLRKYFDTLSASGMEKNGLIKEYYHHEGWYDDSPGLFLTLH